ncbi:unnamed protein product [Fraxinus pennsylvanica]|uniref:Uncharacterized protein n=1 Tax=Fraxinus pennsylvanica TaxID=56036 RepID=A0AAD1ZRV3_9LAMI|nr:unnamed protein product [Fraxinus pennsylvanica]
MELSQLLLLENGRGITSTSNYLTRLGSYDITRPTANVNMMGYANWNSGVSTDSDRSPLRRGYIKSNRQSQEGESTSGNLPDIPKKSRRKKSKESNSVGSSRLGSRSKGSYPGPDAESIVPRIEQ